MIASSIKNTHQSSHFINYCRRPLSSTTATTPKQQQQDDPTYTLLFHRSPSRSTPPRAMLGISTFNLSYWTWYVADFTPSVNAAAQSKLALGQIDAETLDILLIDPKMGYVGLGVSLAIWGGAFMYVKQLVSAMWKGSNGSMAVSGLKLPLLTEPKVLKRTVYDPNSNQFDGVENIQFTQSELESENVEFYSQGDLSISGEKDVNDLLVKFDGEFGKKIGHLALKVNDDNDGSGENGNDTSSALSHLSKQKYLLDIGSVDEIMPNASPHLLRSLVIRDHHLMTGGNKKVQTNNNGRRGSWKHNVKPDESDEDSRANSVNVGRSIKKKGFRTRRNR
eukprot:scaffold14408_cov173-Skeletonema_dohrnii-CCMP3373.AAC.1